MAENQDKTQGPVPPYGQAIWDAVKRGDLHEMEHIADQARQAIARGAKDEGVQVEHLAQSGTAHFHDVASHEVVQVREALTNLEQKINEVRRGQSQSGEGQSGQAQPPAGGTPQQ